MTPESLLQARAAARQQHLATVDALRSLHERAVEALTDPASCDRVRAAALARVAQWEIGHLCHTSYVTTWRALLNLPVAELAVRVLSDSSEAVALRQNSPFGFLVAR